jgi:predicted lipoprotein with Yx(FWY)xxD motif
MRSRIILVTATLALGLLTLAGCAAGTSSPSAGTGTPTSAGNSAGTDLKTASTSLGSIVVEGKGMTVYVYDKDTAGSGTSACTATCASTWPAVTTTTSTPVVVGVTGTVGTITGTNGKTQITLNGLPLYTFASDTAPGAVAGQGYKGIWWAVSPSGDKLTTATKNSNGY